jgi:Predicted membrane protein
MGNKELRRLKRRDLLQMLLTQCEETERLQKKLDERTAELENLQEGYERLKRKLDIKDERLNQKDAKITDLKSEVERIKTSRLIELEEAGSIAEASLRLNGIFEAAQRCAEQYLMNVKRISQNTQEEDHEDQEVSLSIYDQQKINRQKIPYESGWAPVSRRKRLHG